MPIRLITMKFLFGIIVFSLVIPFSPPVSLAKAKMCCKKKCSKMMVSMAESEQKPIKHCNHKKSPIDCCQENCSKIITYEKPERFSLVSKKVEVASPQISISVVSIISDSSLPPTKFPLKQYLDSYRHKIKNPPIFITISSFLI
jgi:hypothetical protein